MKHFIPACKILVLLSILLLLFGAEHADAQLVNRWEIGYATTSTNYLDKPIDVVGLGNGLFFHATSRDLSVTEDLGRTWKSLFFWSNTLSNNYFTDIAAGSRNGIIILADSTERIGGGEVRRSHINITSDGGLTWRRLYSSDGERFWKAAMSGDNHAVVVCLARPVDTIRYTNDGGVSWHATTLPDSIFRPHGLHASGPGLWTILALSGDHRYIFRSSNHGESWQRVGNPLPAISNIDFDDPDLLVGTGSGGDPWGDRHDIIYRSTDQGESWTTVLDTIAFPTKGLTFVEMADKMNGIATGNQVKMWRTTDGGDSWVQDTPPWQMKLGLLDVQGLAYPSAGQAMIASSYRHSAIYRGQVGYPPPTIIEPGPGALLPLRITIEWTPVDGATSYDLELGDTIFSFTGVPFNVFDVPFLTGDNIIGTSIEVEVAPHRAYQVRVKARGNGFESNWSDPAVFHSQGEPRFISTPEFVYPTNLLSDVDTRTIIRWTPSPEATGYDLRVGLDPDFFFILYDSTFWGQTEFPLGLWPDVQYFASLRARDADGFTSESRIITFTTKETSAISIASNDAITTRLVPNVTNGETRVRFLAESVGTSVDATIYDLTGRSRLSFSFRIDQPGLQERFVDVSGLDPGAYTVVLRHHGKEEALPLIVR